MTDQEMNAIITEGEFNQAGFETSRFGATIHVSLNRKVTKLEVETFLDQVFEGCSFVVEQDSEFVRVTVE